MNQDPYSPGTAELKEENVVKTSKVWSVIKKILIGLGVIFGILICLLIWGVFSASKTAVEFDETAEPYIKKFLDDQSPWDYESAKPHFSVVWSEFTTDEQGERIFNYINKLGPLVTVDSIEMQRCFSQVHTSTGKINRCNFDVQATYEKGSAQIFLGLSLENDEIKVMQLQVNSPAFLE